MRVACLRLSNNSLVMSRQRSESAHRLSRNVAYWVSIRRYFLSPVTVLSFTSRVAPVSSLERIDI